MDLRQLILLLVLVVSTSCKSNKGKDAIEEESKNLKRQSAKQVKQNLLSNGYEVFDYFDDELGDTVIMQKYFVAFLKKGPSRSQTKRETDSLQKLHLEHLGRMYEYGYADLSGPFDDDGDISGITIYNVPNIKMADSLANADPMVSAGRLITEIHPL